MTLLERYKEMHEKGVEVYFDADEIIRLLEYFEDENDFEGFTQVLELGLKLHPENTGIKIKECKVYIYREKYARMHAVQLELVAVGDLSAGRAPTLAVSKLQS